MSSIKDFAKVKILVVGDVMLDRYWWGAVTRISPEAPVPVVALESTTLAAGGAANVAANINGLGAFVTLVGVTGDDAESHQLSTVLSDNGISNFELFPVRGRKTTVKTRIIAHSQQIARLDQETISDIDEIDSRKIADQLEPLISAADAVIISDYGKGFLTTAMLKAVFDTCRIMGKTVLVDPKGKDYTKYSGATILTPNKREAAEACGIEMTDPQLVDSARTLILEKLGLEALLITKGEEGMTLLHKDGRSSDLPATARIVYDVTGAGDTVIATLAVAIASGMSFVEAARVANQAAGIVVEKVGTTPISRIDTELLASAIRDHGKAA